jgi:uncharacterized protein (TIGR03503 family)
MGRALRTLLSIGLALLLTGTGEVFAAKPEHADIRVLIDISGSMKQNDPQNLRRPALRMLVGLLQPGSQAGVWTFAKYARELVLVGDVDQAWKERALAASEEINSPGMFTNIELVLERAIRSWEGTDATHRRNLLLLTDGVVDVSKEPGESEASRRRILEELLPRIRAMGAKVHTIALSERADHELLERLARDTDGWYQQVESAEQLQRVFLKLFEQAGRPTGVPLKDNKFRVDNTIREATVLVFRAPGSQEPRLTSPSGRSFGREQAPPFVSWHHDTGYDLITLRDPEAGEWSLSADIDPDNRVMVVTDLKLQLSEMPSRIAVGEQLEVGAHLTNDGRLIKRPAFLELVEMRAETQTAAGLSPWPLNDKGYKGDQTPGDGVYSMKLMEREPRDELTLVVAAESPTFLREHRQRLAVLEPAKLSLTTEGDNAATAALVVDDAVMRTEELRVGAWQQSTDGSRQKLELALQGDGSYEASVPDPSTPVYARVEGVSRLGNAVARDYGPVYAPGTEPAKQPEPEPQPVTQEAAKAEPEPPEAAAEKTRDGAGEPAANEEEETSSWLIPTLAFAGVNLLLIIAGVVFWWLRRRAGDDEEDIDLLLDEGEAPQAGATTDSAEASPADQEEQAAK